MSFVIKLGLYIEQKLLYDFITRTLPQCLSLGRRKHALERPGASVTLSHMRGGLSTCPSCSPHHLVFSLAQHNSALIIKMPHVCIKEAKNESTGKRIETKKMKREESPSSEHLSGVIHPCCLQNSSLHLKMWTRAYKTKFAGFSRIQLLAKLVIFGCNLGYEKASLFSKTNITVPGNSRKYSNLKIKRKRGQKALHHSSASLWVFNLAASVCLLISK